MRRQLAALDAYYARGGDPALGAGHWPDQPPPVLATPAWPAGPVPTRAAPGPRDWSPTPSPYTAPRRRNPRPVGGSRHLGLLLIALVLAVGLAVMLVLDTPLPMPSGSRSAPPAGVDASPGRLRAAVKPPAGTGGYEFSLTQSHTGEPVTFDPCRPIRYVINPAGMPAGAEPIVHDAMKRMGALTGLVFRYDGTTTEPADMDRPAYQPDRYGQRWAPVLVAFPTPKQVPDLSGATAGLGGGTPVIGPDGRLTYTTGQTYFDGPQVREMLAARDGKARVRSLIEHEVGHLVGLDHVMDKTQLMYPEQSAAIAPAAGDKRGLAAVGNGRCAPNI